VGLHRLQSRLDPLIPGLIGAIVRHLFQLDSGKFSPGYIRDQVMYTGRLLDFSRRISKVRQLGTLPADEKNSARMTL